VKFEVLHKQRAESTADFENKIRVVIEHLNETKDGVCWICGESAHNWGVLVPTEGPDGLGFGSGESNGETTTRLAFFPFCTHHELESAETMSILQNRLKVLRSEFTN